MEARGKLRYLRAQKSSSWCGMGAGSPDVLLEAKPPFGDGSEPRGSWSFPKLWSLPGVLCWSLEAVGVGRGEDGKSRKEHQGAAPGCSFCPCSKAENCAVELPKPLCSWTFVDGPDWVLAGDCGLDFCSEPRWRLFATFPLPLPPWVGMEAQRR